MRVLYVQPYVPSYRVPLFTCLAELLNQQGGSLTVAASHPDREMAQRRDSSSAAWARNVRTRSISTPVGEFRYRSLRTVMRARPDVVVMELDPANLNAWASVLGRRHPLVLWGHGKTFTGPERKTVAIARALLARRAQHVMTYTEGGRQALVARGVPSQKVTAVGNATDTDSLQQALAHRNRSPKNVSEAFGVPVTGRRVFMYVGGMDADKRIAFLADAARHAYTHDPTFLLLIAGSGADEHHLDGLDQRFVRRLRRANVTELADMMTVSEGIWMPGRVGLVAVDALAARVPVHTTEFPYHAPEFDLLARGSSLFVHPDDSALFALSSLGVDARRIADDAATVTGVPNIREVATRMLDVLQQATHR